MTDLWKEISYTPESKSWLQALKAVSDLGVDNRPEMFTEVEGWTSARELEEALGIGVAHASSVLKLLYDWKYLKRRKVSSTGGRPPYIYHMTEAGRRRLEKAYRELHRGWERLPETRTPEARGQLDLSRDYEPPRGTPGHVTWKGQQRYKEYRKLREEYQRLREQEYWQTERY